VSAALDLAAPPAPGELPAGYRLSSLAESDDVAKADRVLWRGFDHEGEPPPESLADRRFMQSAPNFRRDLNIVVLDAAGGFAAYAGLWLEPRGRVAYVEPVATDPDHRRRGLGRAAVAEGLRRCRTEGAEVAFVGSELPIYGSLGFAVETRYATWHRRW
jgi:predicted N-acetyltransferase YhbS